MLSSLKLNGLELLDSEDFSVQSVDGLEAPDLRVTSYDKPGEDGGNVTASFMGSRTLGISGKVLGRGLAATHEANRQLLQAACAVTRDSSGLPELAKLEVVTLSAASYFCYVEVKQLKNPVGRGTTSDFLITAVAPDPRLYGASQITTGQISLASGGGFVVPFVVPVTLAAQSGGTATVNQDGNIATYPTLTFRGVLTSPYVLNTESGVAMQLTYTMGASDEVVIDMAEKTILLGGSTPLLSAKADGSDWWAINPGTTVLSFSSGSTSDSGTLEVSYYPATLGL